MKENYIIKIMKISAKKIRAERIALGLTQEEFSTFIDMKYATYKNYEQKGKITFENYIKILTQLKKEQQFLKFLDGFEYNEEKVRVPVKKEQSLNTSVEFFQPIIEPKQKTIVLDKKVFGDELFYSVQDGHVYDIPNFITIVLYSWNDKRLMLLIKYFGEERLKPHILKMKDIKMLKSFNSHMKYIKRKY